MCDGFAEIKELIRGIDRANADFHARITVVESKTSTDLYGRLSVVESKTKWVLACVHLCIFIYRFCLQLPACDTILPGPEEFACPPIKALFDASRFVEIPIVGNQISTSVLPYADLLSFNQRLALENIYESLDKSRDAGEEG